MALTNGMRVGPYEIQAAIGAGGMGEVYRARDTRLKREVALKILPESFASDPERLARFQREAEVLAALNHPHIAQIYGLEESNGIGALVMELVEGPTLADRIALGPLPLDEALAVAKQIAEALEAAHQLGIIHRDLKPANIKVREDGTVKVLDFGLAKALDPAASGPEVAALTQSPTITSPAAMTQRGVILGTAAYMAPEQARGKAVDKRADIWAFGAVLYEMLTGQRAFPGEDVSDTLASILKGEPNWDALPTNVPPSIRTLVQRCLAKDRYQRIADISIARFLLNEPAIIGPPAGATAPTTTPARPLWRRMAPSFTLVAGAVIAGAVVWLIKPSPHSPTSVRLSAELGTDASLAVDQGAAAVLSPDGQLLVFAAQGSGSIDSQLFVRRLDELQATALSDTDGARSPFFSSDGQWVGFFAGGKLKKISVAGGAAVVLCDAPEGRGGSWAEDGTIVFSPNGTTQVSLLRVSSAGGTPGPLTTLAEGETTQRWPQMLPGGRAVLFTSAPTTTAWEDANIVAQPLPTGDRKVVQRGYYGRYLASGHLAYLHDGTLFAAPFDPDRLEVTGQSVRVLEGVVANPTVTGGAQFAAASNGTLVYLPGQSVMNDEPIVWMDRGGKTAPLRAAAASWSDLQFAPDGGRLAIDMTDRQSVDVWVYEWSRDTLTRLTFDPASDRRPVWTPDGRRIVFTSQRNSRGSSLYWQRADGTGDAQRLTESTNTQAPASWHPSGKLLAFQEQSPQTDWDLMILPMDGDDASGWKPGKPTVFLASSFSEGEPMFSPGGQWLAYQSNESGRDEVYVRPFPGPGGKWQISTAGGQLPVWSRTRRELFYLAPDNRIMVATYTVEGGSFQAAKPSAWSDARVSPFLGGPVRRRRLDLHPDGERFAVAPEATVTRDKLVFVFNFFDELRRLAPTTTR